jgi:hypothetical protein
MKKIALILVLFLSTIAYSFAQDVVEPEVFIQFDDEIRTHNMHITSDGNYFYTINGGVPDYGQINKYTLKGEFIKSFPLKLDTRSIMYNNKDGNFYVCTYTTKAIYKITDLESGEYKLLYENVYTDGQACTALSASGKNLYVFENGTITKINLSSGEKVASRSGFKGETNVVAVDAENIYTWDPSTKTVYMQDFEGNLVKTIILPKGGYQFSLSIANGILFTSIDGNYQTGTWYGYKISDFKKKKGNSIDADDPVVTPGGR